MRLKCLDCCTKELITIFGLRLTHQCSPLTIASSRTMVTAITIGLVQKVVIMNTYCFDNLTFGRFGAFRSY